MQRWGDSKGHYQDKYGMSCRAECGIMMVTGGLLTLSLSSWDDYHRWGSLCLTTNYLQQDIRKNKHKTIIGIFADALYRDKYMFRHQSGGHLNNDDDDDDDLS